MAHLHAEVLPMVALIVGLLLIAFTVIAALPSVLGLSLIHI